MRKITFVCENQDGGEPWLISGYGLVMEESVTERWGSRVHELYIELFRDGNDVHQ